MSNKDKNNLTLNLSVASVGKFHDVSLSNFAEKAYLDYALSVVHGRAIPKLSDGLKPVQRRLLFSMVEMSSVLTPNLLSQQGCRGRTRKISSSWRPICL